MTSWFRSWHGAPTDTKWLSIARRAGVAPGVVSAVAWALLDYASQHQDRGCIDGFDIETYSAFSGFDEAQIAAIIDALASKGMIEDDRWESWDKRQPEREDNSNERVRRYRENHRNGTGVTVEQTAPVTQCNAPVTQCNAPDTDTDTDTDTENTLTADAVSAPAESAPQPAPEKPKRATSKPDTTPLLFDPVQDIVLIEALTAHYESLNRRPPAKFQNIAQRDGYRLAAASLGPDLTRQAVTQCIVGNRYALGQIVTSLLRWMDNEKRGGVYRQPPPTRNEPRGYAALRRVAQEVFGGNTG